MNAFTSIISLRNVVENFGKIGKTAYFSRKYRGSISIDNICFLIEDIDTQYRWKTVRKIGKATFKFRNFWIFKSVSLIIFFIQKTDITIIKICLSGIFMLSSFREKLEKKKKYFEKFEISKFWILEGVSRIFFL